MTLRGQKITKPERFESFLNIDNTWIEYDYNFLIEENKNNYLVTTYDGRFIRTYQNNVLLGEEPLVGVLNVVNDSTLNIGISNGEAEFFNGTI